MLARHVPYLGWTAIAERPVGILLRPEEQAAVLARYRDSLRLGGALQIGFHS
jgi:hypothetical protein